MEVQAVLEAAHAALEGGRVLGGAAQLLLEALDAEEALTHYLEVLVQELPKVTPTSEFSVSVIESFSCMLDTSSLIDINFISTI